MSTQEKVADPEAAKPAEAPPPKVEVPPPPAGPPHVARLLTALRGLLFALTLIALLVMVFSKQTREDPFPGPFSGALAEAKFDNYSAFIYFVVAFSVACLYSIITALASISVVLKPAFSASFLLFFVVSDVVSSQAPNFSTLFFFFFFFLVLLVNEQTFVRVSPLKPR
ncbi:hypothetical protein EUGRSUZ_H03772 [Eucalyptus grandis]|uniref:Uncharacterized protein n=2 Tax=Eucalyptus grandis TaxID=71139 RepID=A0ACC3JW32_EUCGR|nr:hypothetical protein EUGRSUZ_H03772 [Eucalyptus grandis]